MCKWTKEDFDNDQIRITIPISGFRDCGEEIKTSDIYLRAKASQSGTEQQPAPLASPSPIETSSPTSTPAIGLLMFGAGVVLFGWLIRSALRPKNNHQPVHQNPTE